MTRDSMNEVLTATVDNGYTIIGQDVATNATLEEEESNQSAEDEDSIESAGDGEESIESAESVEGAEEKKKSYTLLGVEVVAALYAASIGITSVINMNLILDKICLVNLNYSEAVCSNLSLDAYDLVQNQVQAEATTLNMYATLMAGVPVVFLSIIMGTLSDRLGIKFLLTVPIIGMIVGQMFLLVNVLFWELRAEYILLCSLYSIFGGSTTFFIGLYSHTSDISCDKSRTARISILDATVTASTGISGFLSAYIYSYWGYAAIYAISIALLVIDMILVVFFIKTVSPKIQTQSWNYKELSPLVIFRSLFRRRAGYRRSKILILFLSMLMFVSMSMGDFSYLYTRKVLNWDEQIYTKVSSLGIILNCFSSVLVLPLLSYYVGLPDALLGCVAILSAAVGQIFIGMARTNMLYLIGILYGSFTNIPSSTIRSLLAKQVSKGELSQIYSHLGCLESLIPLLVTPIVTLLYNATLNIHPSTIFYCRSALAGLIGVNFCVLHWLEKKEKLRIRTNETADESTPLIS